MVSRGDPRAWAVFAAFAVAYLAYFIWPAYSGAALAFHPPSAIAAATIGGDLDRWVAGAQALLEHRGMTFYYPPLAYVLAVPLTLFDHQTAFRALSVITLMGFAWIAVALPRLAQPARPLSGLHVLIALTGFLSYGLQFELERGQFNVLAMACGLSAVWLFHYQPNRRPVAYLLLAIAVQMKVYPAILALALVDDWRDWRPTVKRWLGLGLLNLALLLATGPANAWQFIRTTGRIVLTEDGWRGNHSIRSFVTLPRFVEMIGVRNVRTVELLLTGFVAVCLAMLVTNAVRRRGKGLQRELLLGCCLTALMIPAVSHDYTLSTLPAAMAFLFVADSSEWRADGMTATALFVLTLAYATTLFPMETRPPLLQNSFPMLATMLISTVAISARTIQD